MTNTATCADYVLNNGGAMSEACEYSINRPILSLMIRIEDWEVKSVKVYQTN